MSDDEFQSTYKSTKKHFYIKFINISQSFGMKIEIGCNSKKPINIFTANFNKIVKSGIKIKSFIFTFNVPNNDLRFTVLKQENLVDVPQFINYDGISEDHQQDFRELPAT